MINRIAEHLDPAPRSAAQGQGAESLDQATDLKRDWIEPLERVIADYPAACLATAFIVGVAIAWWIKRN